MKRSEVKENHENSVLEAFKSYSASIGNTVVILSKPEPPDALITINNINNWIEITDAFITPGHAISITTGISEDKEWRQAESGVINVDNFNEILKSVIQKKYDKKSIKEVYNSHGQGILIVGCFSPFHYPIQDCLEDLTEVVKEIISLNEELFKEIYLYDYDYKPVKVV